MGAEPQRLVEDDGAETSDGPDCDAEHDPALQVRRRADPSAHRGGAAAGAHRAAGMRRVDLRVLARPRAHRSQPVLQSCSGTSPAVSLKCQRGHDPVPRPCGNRCDELLDLLASPSGHGVDQSAAPRRQGDTDLAPVAPVGPASHQALFDQTVAHPRRGGRRDRDRVGQRRHALGTPEASTTSERYWVKVTSSPTSASDRAAMATRTRLALRTASTSCSSVGGAMGVCCI